MKTIFTCPKCKKKVLQTSYSLGLACHHERREIDKFEGRSKQEGNIQGAVQAWWSGWHKSRTIQEEQ